MKKNIFKNYVLLLILSLFFTFAYMKTIKFFVTATIITPLNVILIVDLFFVIIFLLMSYFLYSFKVNSIDKCNNSSYYWIILSIIMALVNIIVEHIYYWMLNLSANSNTIYFSNAIKTSPVKGIIATAILGPIFEELVFRQLVFGMLYDFHRGCNRYVRFITALLISGLWFASMHRVAIFSISATPYIIYSIFFSLIYVYTKNIKSSILTHMLVNFILIVLYDLNI